MDPNTYKDIRTKRGFTYHYYCSPPRDNTKSTLLLLHGFPSGSHDWENVVKFFQQQGYGLIVPDLLGYGGTDKPSDPEAYRMKLMVADVIDILDGENASKVISIAHDWGSGLNSRLANYYPERFIAFAFLALGYLPPIPVFDIDAINAMSLEKNGYSKFGYWKFFAEADAAKILEEHIESFFSLVFGEDEDAGKKYFCPEGALKKWLLEDRTAQSNAPFFSAEERKRSVETFLKGGFTGPLCWYKAFVFKHTAQDDAGIPKEKYIIAKPVFFGAALKDAACVADENKAVIEQTCPSSTIVDFDTGHWVLNEAPERLNEELQKWVQALA
ncbi:hypothetical protein M0805_004794 [Coniferiporia weirii]|nr:hypothetical protein M0805_004794 [Coniferiporia weirii]